MREVRALGPGGIVWDAVVTGFAARRQKGEAVAYLVRYRTAQGRQRWHVIGRLGAPWTPETARATRDPVPEGADILAVPGEPFDAEITDHYE